MRAPKSWIAEFAALPSGLDGRALGEALISAGLEVEAVETIGGELSGPVVVGRVLGCVDEPQKNGKTIRWCHVDVGPAHAPEVAPEPLRAGEPVALLPGGYWPRGIVCGALNFAAGDFVVVALPGSVLPGGFELGSRRTYGHLSDGMICAVDELGLGSDHTGILVLPDAAPSGAPWVLGADALDAMGVRDEVLDMPVTPDMGYCLSIRGLAREAAQALDVPFTDPIDRPTPPERHDGHGVRLETDRCPLFVALTVTGVDPSRPTPAWLAMRLEASGMRSINLPVDISNYVMLESGQPNHCYDADLLVGDIVVRQALPGERLVTLDDVDRALDPEDVVIADDAGPIGLGGVMGGERTELRDTTRTIVIECAHFDPIAIARTSRRHRLGSEASRRFERTVDPGAAYGAAHRVAQLLVELAGGTLSPAETVAGSVPAMPEQTIAASLPADILGMPVDAERVVAILERSGVSVTRDGDRLRLVPPTWRPDLVDPYDYVEEVGTKVGLDKLPSVVPPAPVGRGLTPEQRLRRSITRALVTAGFVEVLSFPFLAETDLDALGVGDDDGRRRLVRLANPLADTAPFLRTTLLPGLFAAVQRNTSRGNDDLALFEAGRVFLAGEPRATELLPVTRRPSDAEVAALDEALPDQPRHLAAVLTGAWKRPGWQGPGEPAGWQHALVFADVAASVLGLGLRRTPAEVAPWHPGRCAALSVGDVVVGHAGELHPTVCKRFGLPPRTAAAELDLDLLVSLFGGPGTIAPVSPHPVAKEDLALVVAEAVPTAELADAIRAGAGPLLESVALFDIYRGAPVPEGRKSCAFALRFRAADHTLKDAEIAAAREGAIAAARERCAAELRDF
nr:phenylalanine--tRNA ligase subunit beta [Propionibacterium sp.]